MGIQGYNNVSCTGTAVTLFDHAVDMLCYADTPRVTIFDYGRKEGSWTMQVQIHQTEAQNMQPEQQKIETEIWTSWVRGQVKRDWYGLGRLIGDFDSLTAIFAHSLRLQQTLKQSQYMLLFSSFHMNL